MGGKFRWTWVVVPVIVLLTCLVSYIALRYTTRNDSVNSKNGLVAPPQEAYRKDPKILATIHFLSRRWNVRSETIYVLVDRRGLEGIELGVVQSSSLSSARLFISPTSRPDLERDPHELLPDRAVVYLVNEFKPRSPQEIKIASEFYASETLSLTASPDYAVIVWWNVAPSGDGVIKALTNFGYPTFPVEHGVVDKSIISID